MATFHRICTCKENEKTTIWLDQTRLRDPFVHKSLQKEASFSPTIAQLKWMQEDQPCRKLQMATYNAVKLI
jgi:hypothetical protein